MNSYKKRSISTLLMIPSFYGLLTWVPAALLYYLRILPWNEPSLTSTILFIVVPVMFVCSLFIFHHSYSDLLRVVRLGHPPSANTWLLGCLHIIGLGGLALYVIDFSAALGGLRVFSELLIDSSYMIRWEAETTESVGTQISYLGWIAAAVTVSLVKSRQISRAWLILAALQFVGNVLFIGRTRPVWMFAVTLVMLAPLSKDLSTVRLTKLLTGTMAVLVGVIVFLGMWIGKISSESETEKQSEVPFVLQSLYLYSTAGFAYFDAIQGEPPRAGFEGVLYPLYQLGSKLSLVQRPRSQVNDNLSVPYAVNVGTFMEPFYRDGGYLLVLLGIVLLTFGIDWLALVLWRMPSYYSWHAAGQLCFVSGIAFFTPKISSFPIWLFLLLGFLTPIFQRMRSRRRGVLPGPNNLPASSPSRGATK
jgi:oligosaccharide repeat unit polymerase